MPDTDLHNVDQKPKGVFTTFVADGDWMLHKGEYKKAIESYTRALTLKPGDSGCYVGISKCYLMMGNPESALKEAEASLKGDKTCFEGLYQKAEALYYMGEFEFAKVCYHRGLQLRPEIQEFRVGIQKAQEAMENAVGCPPSVKLEKKGDLKFFQKDEETHPATAIQQLMVEKKQQTTMKPKSEKRNKQLLGEFYSDKKYLEDLLKDKDLIEVTTKKGERLQDVIKGSLSYLDTCTEFRNNEKTIVGQKACKPTQKEHRPKSSSCAEPLQFFMRSLEEIDSELMCGNAEASLKKAEQVMKTVQTWSLKEVPDKKKVLAILHTCIANALFELGDIDKALEHHQKDLELAKKCKHQEAMSRALENIGHVYAQTGQFEQAIEFREKRIPLVHGALEKICLFHELGCCNLELNRNEEAQKYGLRSVAAAEETDDEKWKMNSNFLVAQSEFKLGCYESSVSHFEIALSHAKLQDDDSATNAIQEALDEAKQHLIEKQDV